MKKIQPAWRYDLDDGYPSDAEATKGHRSGITRRGGLGALAVGAATFGATLGGSLLLPTEARAGDKPTTTPVTTPVTTHSGIFFGTPTDQVAVLSATWESNRSP